MFQIIIKNFNANNCFIMLLSLLLPISQATIAACNNVHNTISAKTCIVSDSKPDIYNMKQSFFLEIYLYDRWLCVFRTSIKI